MNALVVGDVHGCYHTLKSLIKVHWRPDEALVLVGDLINKGKFSVRTVRYVRKLQKKNPGRVTVLLGNHEHDLVKAHEHDRKSPRLKRFKRGLRQRNMSPRKIIRWMRNLPLKWETSQVLVTHAGVCHMVKQPYNAGHPFGVVHNRSQIKNIGKLQVYGHIVQEHGEPHYDEEANAWCIDSGAWLGNGLTALRIGASSDSVKIIRQPTHNADL